jgi:translation initiation factor eIF-2B subunit alpha
MDNVDFVLVGSEAVVESGGLINAVGSHQMAIIAKAANKPFYALAERLDYLLVLRDRTNSYFSYKFHRLFPLSQYDLPTHNPSILSFPRTGPPSALSGPPPPSSVSQQQDRISVLNEASSASSVPLSMTPEQISRNPYVDYTRYSGILYHSG